MHANRSDLPIRTAALLVTSGLWAGPVYSQTDAAAPAGVSGMTKEEAIAGIIRACTDNPSQKGCVDLRNACNAQRGAWKGDMVRICPVLVGSGGSSAAIRAEDIDKTTAARRLANRARPTNTRPRWTRSHGPAAPTRARACAPLRANSAWPNTRRCPRAASDSAGRSRPHRHRRRRKSRLACTRPMHSSTPNRRRG